MFCDISFGFMVFKFIGFVWNSVIIVFFVWFVIIVVGVVINKKVF